MAEDFTLVAEKMDRQGTANSQYPQNLDITGATADNFTFVFSAGENENGPAYNGSKKDIRLYQKNTMTVKTNDGTNMTAMTFTISAQGKKRLTTVTADNGTATSNGADTWTVTWTGNANEVTFTVDDAKAIYGTESDKAGQFDWSEVVITTDGEKTVSSTPVISPKSGNFIGEQTVTITATEGAKIYYTTDNTDPTTASQLYSSPIKLTATTTIKAIAVEGDLKPSSVAEATFTKIEAVSVGTLKELIEKGLTDETTVFHYTGTAAVTYQNGQNLYVQDASAALLIFGSGLPTYKNGDRITGFSGTFKNYYSTYELMADAASFAAAESNEAIAPAVIDVEEVTGDIQNSYIILKNVTINTTDKTFVDAKDATIAYYNKFNVELPADGANAFDVECLVSYYTQKGADAPTVQVYPVKVIGAAPVANEVSTIKEFIEQGQADTSKIFTYTGTAAVTYQNGQNLYIQDESAAILVYDKEKALPTYKNGDLLTGFKGSFYNYFSTYQLTPVVESFSQPSGFKAFNPAAVNVTEITAEIQNQYVIVQNVTVDAANTALVNGNNSIKYYNKFKIDIPADDVIYNVTAVVNYYQAKGADAPEVQVYPIEFTSAAGVDSVVAGEVVASEYYNMQGVKLNAAPEKGMYIVRSTYSDGRVAAKAVVK